MYLKRDLEKVIKEHAKFPVVVIQGPRQSGKTTLATTFFKKHTYLSFEDPEIRAFAQTDPKRFLRNYENSHGLILDEFQYVPQILSYIQLDVDQRKKSGYFILTGSQNFLVNEAVIQSLAGRVGILMLLPFSLHELKSNDLLPQRLDDAIFNGCYPRLHEKKISAQVFYRSYVHTYLQRDVRQLINVGDLRTFQKFMALCAGRVGQQLNIDDLAVSTGIARDTVNRWLSLLEASYILFFLRPYFNNFNKRLTKTPKLYFYDTGLACALLGIKKSSDIALSPFRGPLFESYVVADLCKQFQNLGEEPPLYFWRDQNGRLEVDCLIDTGIKLVSVEIKSGETISGDFFDQLSRWQELSGAQSKDSFVVYGGNAKQVRSTGSIIGWQQCGILAASTQKTMKTR